MEALPERKTPGGFDAYCHVCWLPVYVLWVDDEPPEHDRCPVGPYTAQTCPNATGDAQLRADMARLRAEGKIASRKNPDAR